MLLLLQQQQQLLQQQQQQQEQVAGFSIEQRRLGTAALVSPKGREEADWIPHWGSGSGSGLSRIQDWGSDYDASSEASRLLLQMSPLSASAASTAAAAAAQEEQKQTDALLRAWGIRIPDSKSPAWVLRHRQVLTEAHFTFQWLQ